MKKLGIIVALALVVTISGTYAAWNYTVANGNVADATATAGITLEAENTITVDSGTITVDISPDFKISVDDDGTHNAKLEITGSITISFTGSSATGDVKGLNLTCSASDNCTQYQGNNVFKYTTLNANREVGDGSVDGYDKWVITGADLESLISLNGTVSAATSADYNLLKDAINGKTITLTVSAHQ